MLNKSQRKNSKKYLKAEVNNIFIYFTSVNLTKIRDYFITSLQGECLFTASYLSCRKDRQVFQTEQETRMKKMQNANKKSMQKVLDTSMNLTN